MNKETFWKEIISKIEASSQMLDSVSSQDNDKVKIQIDGTELAIYQNNKLVGYKIYRTDSPEKMFMSDNDLYEDEQIKESVQKEVAYILEYFLKREVTINNKPRRNWYGKTHDRLYISLVLPTGEREEYPLPCINQVDFGF